MFSKVIAVALFLANIAPMVLSQTTSCQKSVPAHWCESQMGKPLNGAVTCTVVACASFDGISGVQPSAVKGKYSCVGNKLELTGNDVRMCQYDPFKKWWDCDGDVPVCSIHSRFCPRALTSLPYNQMCYEAFNDPPMTWSEAWDHCKSLRGELADMASGGLDRHFKKIVTSFLVDRKEFWIDEYFSKQISVGKKETNCLNLKYDHSFIVNGWFHAVTHIPCEKKIGHICQFKPSFSRIIETFCGQLPKPANGRKVESNLTEYGIKEDGITSFACDRGFQLNGSEVRTCKDIGLFDGNDTKCDPIDCGHPGEIDHGEVQFEDTQLNSEALYTCNDGYKLNIIKNTRVCISDGVWTGEKLECYGEASSLYDEHGQLKKMWIYVFAGVAAGLVIGIVAGIIACYCHKKRKAKKAQQMDDYPPDEIYQRPLPMSMERGMTNIGYEQQGYEQQQRRSSLKRHGSDASTRVRSLDRSSRTSQMGPRTLSDIHLDRRSPSPGMATAMSGIHPSGSLPGHGAVDGGMMAGGSGSLPGAYYYRGNSGRRSQNGRSTTPLEATAIVGFRNNSVPEEEEEDSDSDMEYKRQAAEALRQMDRRGRQGSFRDAHLSFH